MRCSVVTSRAAADVANQRGPLEPTVYPALSDWGWKTWSHLVRLIDYLRPDVLHVQYQTGAFGMAPFPVDDDQRTASHRWAFANCFTLPNTGKETSAYSGRNST